MIRGMFDRVFGTGNLDRVYDSLKINLFDSAGTYGSAVEVINVLYENVIAPVALCLLCIYFLVGLVDKLTSEHFTWEQAVRQFCMLIAGFALIEHGLELMNLLVELGLDLTDKVYTRFQPDIDEVAGAKLDALYNNFLAETDIGWEIFADAYRMVYLLLPWAFSWLISIAVTVIVYSRVIEIYARACFAPIAFSDFFQNGFHGAGWKFLKSFLAVALQGALILIITIIFGKLSQVLFGEFDDNIGYWAAMGQYLAFEIAAIMLMMRSLSLSKELVGVQ